MPSNPLRDMGNGFLILGALVLVVSLGLSVAQVLVAQVSERNYGFAALALPGIAVAALLLAAGSGLRLLSEPRPAPEVPDREED